MGVGLNRYAYFNDFNDRVIASEVITMISFNQWDFPPVNGSHAAPQLVLRFATGDRRNCFRIW